jgi:hypothetical protein
MDKRLSFEPRYHEIGAGDHDATWVPVYNPARECVLAERRQIEADGGRVNSRAWKMPRAVRLQVWQDNLLFIDGLVIWLLIALYIGEGLTRFVFHWSWAMQLSASMRGACSIGMGLAVIASVTALVRFAQSRRKQH